jgi:photosystem II stability/assembly factor-like uncharacterized protein
MKQILQIIIALGSFASAEAQWIPLNTGTTSDLFVITKNQAGDLFAASRGSSSLPTPGIIIRLANGGSFWSTVAANTSGFTDISFLSATTAVAIPRTKDTILRTTDGGSSWQQEYSQNCFGSVYGFPNVHFTDAMTGYAPGYKTTDGGASWVLQYQAVNMFPYTPSAIAFVNDSTGIIAGNNYWGLNYKTTNRGVTWTPVNVPFHTWEILSLSMPTEYTGYCTGIKYASVKEAEIIKTSDGGDNWTSIYTGPYSSLLRSIFCTDSNTCYAVGYKGTIIKTTNGGMNWAPQPSGTTQTLNKVFFTDANTGYIAGDSGVILKTSNAGGPTAVRHISSSANAVSIYPNPAKEGVAIGSFTEVYKVQLIALSGAVVKEQLFEAGAVNPYVSLTGISPGAYFVQVYDRDGTRASTKLIKQ